MIIIKYIKSDKPGDYVIFHIPQELRRPDAEVKDVTMAASTSYNYGSRLYGDKVTLLDSEIEWPISARDFFGGILPQYVKAGECSYVDATYERNVNGVSFVLYCGELKVLVEIM